MTIHIIDFLYTKHVMDAIKHSLGIRKQSPHPPKKTKEQINEDGANYDGGRNSTWRRISSLGRSYPSLNVFR